jgi:hypothetical protein
MGSNRRHIAAELRVLQEAVASAVHELSQPLNVVNLLADNALDDVTTLQAAAAADPAVLAGLRHRVEAIIDQAGKASDITRWIRAFAVGTGQTATEFDPGAVIERIVGIFSNDLRVAGVNLIAEPARGKHQAFGDESLLAFALTETVLWMSRTLQAPVRQDMHDEHPGREIRIRCGHDEPTRSAVIDISGDVIADGPPPKTASSAVAHEFPAALPLLSLAGRAPGSVATFARLSEASLRVRLSLPCAATLAEATADGDD